MSGSKLPLLLTLSWRGHCLGLHRDTIPSSTDASTCRLLPWYVGLELCMAPHLPPSTYPAHLIVLTFFFITYIVKSRAVILLDTYYVHTTKILQGWRGGARREKLFVTLYPEYVWPLNCSTGERNRGINAAWQQHTTISNSVVRVYILTIPSRLRTARAISWCAHKSFLFPH